MNKPDIKQAKKGVVKAKKKHHRVVSTGIAHVKATFNNTIITITDSGGQTLVASSGGQMDVKGSRKASGWIATLAGEEAAKKAKAQFGMQELEEVRLNGPGQGRESSVRGLGKILSIAKIKDTTPIAHNGCRGKKRRRV